MLKFLGVGAAFNYNLNNTSAFFVDSRTLFLFDCAEKICDRILEKQLLNNVDKVYCFITHLHSDHVASLEPLMFYLKYINKKYIYVFYPNPKRLKKLVQLMGIVFDFEIYDNFSLIKEIKIEPVKQKHTIGSFGYFVYTNNKNFFYSGDTSRVNTRAINELKNLQLDLIYHEATLSPNATIHTHLSKLEKAIPYKLRNKVFLMHLPNEEIINVATEKGFNICNEIE